MLALGLVAHNAVLRALDIRQSALRFGHGAEHEKRWRFDYRLYRDVLTNARENGIPFVGLDAPSELVA